MIVHQNAPQSTYSSKFSLGAYLALHGISVWGKVLFPDSFSGSGKSALQVPSQDFVIQQLAECVCSHVLLTVWRNCLFSSLNLKADASPCWHTDTQTHMHLRLPSKIRQGSLFVPILLKKFNIIPQGNHFPGASTLVRERPLICKWISILLLALICLCPE